MTPTRRAWPAAVLGLGLACAGFSTASAEESRFCRDDGATVILFLDVTTPYDATDRDALIHGVGAIFDTLQGGERVVIRTIEDEFSRSRRLFAECVPYCPSSGFFGDLFSDCTEGMVINERKRFAQSLVNTLQGLLASAKELDHSEIVRTLSAALVEEYRKGRTNRIYIYSDMIENSGYIRGRDFFAAKDGVLIDKIANDGLVPDIADADVRVFGTGRTGIAQDRAALDQERLKKLRDFWTKYFAAGGAPVQMYQNLTAD